MRCLRFVLLSFLFCPFTYAQEKMPEVVVSGQQFSIEEAKILQIPGGADFIPAAEYKQGRATTLPDVLGFSPGVIAQQRDTGAQESRISIRGSGLQRTFHLRGVQILQDGIPLNNADGAGDLYKIEPLATEHTEVYRGGNALRYGATTLGGAINFASPTGHTASRLQSRAEVGSFGYVRSQISSGQVMGASDYYVSLSQFKQDGFRDHTTQDNHYEFFNFGQSINEYIDTRFFVTNAVTKAKLGGGLTKQQMQNNPRQAAATSVSGNRKRDIDYVRVANKTTYVQDEHRLEASAYWFNIDLFHPITQVLDQDSHDFGGDVAYTNSSDLGGRPNELTIGFNPSLGFIQDDRYTNVGGEKGSRFAEADQKAYNLNLYMEDRFQLFERLQLVEGLQASYASRQSTDYFPSNGDDSGAVIYRSLNPKSGLLYDLTEDTKAFFNYTKSYEPPTFSELFNASADFLPNKAQRSHTWETGIRKARGKVQYDVVYYYSLLSKELLSLSDPSGAPLGTVNARSKTVHQGVELGTKAEIIEGLSLRNAYTFGRFRFQNDEVYGDNQLPGLPEHFIKMELLYEHKSGLYAGPNWERALASYPIDMANTFYADPYSVWGLKAGYKIPQGLSLFIEGKNLSDKVYAASTGIVNNAAGLDTNAIFNPGNGRAWYGGLEWAW